MCTSTCLLTFKPTFMVYVRVFDDTNYTPVRVERNNSLCIHIYTYICGMYGIHFWQLHHKFKNIHTAMQAHLNRNKNIYQ